MKRASVSDVLATANAAMVARDPDVTGALAALLAGVVDSLPARAAAVLVEVEGALQLLAATNHRVADLEAYQSQVDDGPCLDALRTSTEVHAVGADELERRWPLTGPVIVAAGYRSVQALPLTWQGRVFGALNVFRENEDGFAEQQAECRALADAVTLVIASSQPDEERIVSGLNAALEERALVELAKGALAHTLSRDMSGAFEALLDLAHEEGLTLGTAARQVMLRARTGTLDMPSTST